MSKISELEVKYKDRDTNSKLTNINQRYVNMDDLFMEIKSELLDVGSFIINKDGGSQISVLLDDLTDLGGSG